ncbi:MAG TPA: hypothetical protein DCY07_07875 [Rhodospirillaceae bacterium]|nr:hypothetical protein [Rhodospirillaceae bacterium]
MQTEAEIESFLRDAHWGGVPREPLASGYSSRLFYRLHRTEGNPRTAILMRANPDQKTEAFVNLAALLRRIDLPAPTIYASDLVRDLVLMEDFGDNPVGQLLDQGRDPAPFDEDAAAFLATLHKRFQQSMLGGAYKTPLYNAALLTDQTTLFLDHYYPRLFRRAATARERGGFVQAWQSVLSPLDTLPRSLLLRDFMPDNMMALSAPVLGHPMGVIDFQDAGIGCVAYDIASWCEEVRRDGGLARLPQFVATYNAQNPAIDEKVLLNATRVYAAQRHTRILGLLVKLDRTEHLPRVWRTVQALLREEALAPVRRWFTSCPPPSL